MNSLLFDIEIVSDLGLRKDNRSSVEELSSYSVNKKILKLWNVSGVEKYSDTYESGSEMKKSAFYKQLKMGIKFEPDGVPDLCSWMLPWSNF